MPPRRILPLTLACVAAATIGLLVWVAAGAWLGRSAITDLRDEAQRVAAQQNRLFASDLMQFRLLPLVLGEYTDLDEALRRGDTDARRRMDGKLKLLAERTGAPVLYLIDRNGRTVSASNADTAESFVGRDYRFRPYFIRAMQDGAAEYYAVGNVSGRPGLFLTRRIGTANDPAGVIVVKVEFDKLVRNWRRRTGWRRWGRSPLGWRMRSTSRSRRSAPCPKTRGRTWTPGAWTGWPPTWTA